MRCITGMRNTPIAIAIKLATLELKLQHLLNELKQAHWVNEPRLPRGDPHGGRWTRVGGASGTEERVKTAFGAIYMFERQFAHPVLGLARECFYRDTLDRWFSIPTGIFKECPPTYPADPTEEG